MAAISEFWRSHRQVAGLLYFCGLGYSRHDGETSDNFIDMSGPFEPAFGSTTCATPLPRLA